MIKRDDMLELTRRMTPSRSCFTRIAGCYFDGDGFVDETFNVNFLKLSGSDKAKNLAIAKEIPFAGTNDQLKEYHFAAGADRPGGPEQLLRGIRECGLKNDLLMEVLYEQLAGNYRSEGEGYGFIFHGRYDVPAKAKDGALLGESEEVYEFIICAVGPADSEYNAGRPDFGFLYPAFADRGAMLGGIDIFNRNPNEPAGELMAELLGLSR